MTEARGLSANHFLCGDFVEYYEPPETARDLAVPLGTPGEVARLTAAVAVDVVWSCRSGGVTFDAVYDQDRLRRISADQFALHYAQVTAGERPGRSRAGLAGGGYPPAWVSGTLLSGWQGADREEELLPVAASDRTMVAEHDRVTDAQSPIRDRTDRAANHAIRLRFETLASQGF